MSTVAAVIMAGGVGTRFWPRSREKSPKQLLEIFGKGSMLQGTVRRLSPVIPPERTFVVTNRLQRALVLKQLPQVPEENIIDEPVGRNTAPCIGLAALHVRRLAPDAVMFVSPSDHVIHDDEEFLRTLNVAVEVAHQSQSLLTIGITPSRPETGYGYIQVHNDEGVHNPYVSRGVLRVKTFAEKPNLPTAQQFLASGDFLWNSGMFVWRVDTILREIQRCLPDLFGELMKIDETIGTPQYQPTLETVYGMIRGISIDYGVMEKADHVFVIPGRFGWNDLGSWDEVARLVGKDAADNSITGKVILKDTRGTYVYSPEGVVAVVGVEDLIVVNTGDALLICKKGKSQDVKEICDYLKRKQMNDYL
jgi:mannose-1-phosphate guanylyltransferase